MSQPTPTPLGPARKLGLVGLTVAIVAVVTTRVLLFSTGALFGDAAVLYANLATAAVLGGAVLVMARLVSRRDSLTRAGAILALAVASVGVIGLVAPSTPTLAAAPACRGVAVLGARFFAQTTGDSLAAAQPASAGMTPADVAPGVNARTGPSTTYPQTDRFAGDCTLGFDGYCVGSPVDNLVTDLPDTRWLILHGRHDEFVASAKVLSQSPEANLGTAPAPACRSHGGLSSPGSPHFVPTAGTDGTVTLAATAKGADIVGYAINQIDPSDGSYPYAALGEPITESEKTPAFSGKWDTSTAVPLLNGGAGSVELAAATCLAGDVPVMPPSVYKATFANSTLASLTPMAPATFADGARLAQTACSAPN